MKVEIVLVWEDNKRFYRGCKFEVGVLDGFLKVDFGVGNSGELLTGREE